MEPAKPAGGASGNAPVPGLLNLGKVMRAAELERVGDDTISLEVPDITERSASPSFLEKGLPDSQMSASVSTLSARQSPSTTASSSSAGVGRQDADTESLAQEDAGALYTQAGTEDDAKVPT